MCTVVKQQDGTGHVTMKAQSQVQGRVMTCSLSSNTMESINPTQSEPNTQNSVLTGRGDSCTNCRYPLFAFMLCTILYLCAQF